MKLATKFQLFALIPILLFIALRAVIYQLYPIDTFEDWVHVDFIKNIPRIICTLLAIYISIKFIPPGTDQNIFSNRGWQYSIFFICLILSFSWFNGLWNPPQPVSTTQIFYIAIGSLCVAILEEFCFRYLLVTSLMKTMSSKKAILLSSITFMLFHIQAQPLYTFPFLFFAGIQYASLRLLDVSIIWLVLVHASYDTIIFYLESPNQNFGYLFTTTLHFILAIFLYKKVRN